MGNQKLQILMDQSFYKNIFRKQQEKEAVPSNKIIAGWALRLIGLLYPGQSRRTFSHPDEVAAEFKSLKEELTRLLDATRACRNCNSEIVSRDFFSYIPELYELLNKDMFTILGGDPAAKSEFEVVRTYPGFFAISFYRIAHALLRLEVPLLPRILTEYAHSRTGIDIHPGAIIGEYFFIDHGTGIVIGETAQIGSYVKLYQGVTLGALSVDKSMASIKRHPTVEDHVVIYSNATILGGETVIGHHSVIGGNVWLMKSVPPGSTVFHRPHIEVIENKIPH